MEEQEGKVSVVLPKDDLGTGNYGSLCSILKKIPGVKLFVC